MARQRLAVVPGMGEQSVAEHTAAENLAKQQRLTQAVDRLQALLLKAMEVLAAEMEGKNRLHAAVHVLKACRLYGAEVTIGPTDSAEIALEEKERVKKRQQREFFVNIG